MRLVPAYELADATLHALALRIVDGLGGSYPDWTPAEAERDLRNRDGLPYTICMIDDAGDVIASAALLATDEVSDYEHITPWLGDVYVVPEMRSRGIGATVVRAVLDAAWQRGFDAVHLVTDDAQQWYRKLGWNDVADVDVHGHTMHCMRVQGDAAV